VAVRSSVMHCDHCLRAADERRAASFRRSGQSTATSTLDAMRRRQDAVMLSLGDELTIDARFAQTLARFQQLKPR